MPARGSSDPVPGRDAERRKPGRFDAGRSSVSPGGIDVPATATQSRPLHRSASDRMIGGVCGGIAEWLGWNPTGVRWLYVLVSIFSVAFPGIVAYILLWIAMPPGD